MNVIITCGPSYEPIDGMRRLTNASTGELGLMLAEKMSAAGHHVTVLCGEMATSRHSPGSAKVVAFSTNDDLLRKLSEHRADAVFHAAALCDFRVKEARSENGAVSAAAKIPTRKGNVTLVLEPTTKVLPNLRRIFPDARIFGWKFELDGTRDDVIAKATAQLNDCATDGCIVNGGAWGGGFGFVAKDAMVTEIAGRTDLCNFLTSLL